MRDFTDRARRALTLASQEALRMGNDHIGTEHLLLGIVKGGSGSAAVVLEQFTIGLGAVRQKVEELVHGPNTATAPPGRLRQTERYAHVLSYSMEEAKALSHNYVGTEHLLLGLLREPEGTAARALANLKLNFQDVRDSIMSVLGKAPKAKDSLLEQAMKDLSLHLADESIEMG